MAVQHAIDNTRPAWTRRELLVFPNVLPSGMYNLPFFLHNDEVGGPLLFTDEKGQVLDYCEDQVYEAIDHRLFWVRLGKYDCDEDVISSLVHWRATIYAYSSVLPGSASVSENDMPLQNQGQVKSPEEVLLLTDFFQAGDEDQPSNWDRVLRNGEDEESSTQFAIKAPLPEAPRATQRNEDGNTDIMQSKGSQFEPTGQALRLDPGMGRVVMKRSFDARGSGSRIHLRVHFYDTLTSTSAAHWIGLTFHLGSAALGVAAEFGDCYAFANGGYPDGYPGRDLNWQQTAVPRTLGWHLFELIWEDGVLFVIIDGEPVNNSPAKTFPVEGSQRPMVWLVAKKGGLGYWAGMEIFHTPIGQSTWAAGVQDVTPHDRSPWKLLHVERGVWQIWHDGQQCLMTGQADPPIVETKTLDEPELDVNQMPCPTQGSLTIECWSLPGPESDLARIERVMEFFIKRLQDDGVVIPANVQRLAQCQEKQHPTCYVYRFGTRRLHVSTREIEGGRLCLVVRCGGGFFDFAEFARRHGSVEQLKLQRLSEPQGRQIIQLSSVLRNRQHRINRS